MIQTCLSEMLKVPSTKICIYQFGMHDKVYERLYLHYCYTFLTLKFENDIYIFKLFKFKNFPERDLHI